MIKTTTNSWPDVRLVVVGGTHRIHKGFTPVCDFFLQILTLRQAEQPSLETFKASFLSSNRHQISRANSFTPLGEVAIGCVDEFVSCFISTMYVALPGHYLLQIPSPTPPSLAPILFHTSWRVPKNLQKISGAKLKWLAKKISHDSAVPKLFFCWSTKCLFLIPLHLPTLS